MLVETCPMCGRAPMIVSGVYLLNGAKGRAIGCPNLCDSAYRKRYDAAFDSSTHPWIGWMGCAGNPDDNALYKMWNENVKAGWFKKERNNEQEHQN